MKPVRFFIVTLVGALFLGAVPLAGAQSSPASAQDTTDAEKEQFAQMALEEMGRYVTEVSQMLETAEREDDVVKKACLRKTLTTMRSLHQVTEGAVAEMRQAIKAGNDARAGLEYRKIGVALSKVREFRAQADGCVGGAYAQTGTTEVKIIEEAVSTADLEDILSPDYGFEDAQPPESSPFSSD